MKLTDLLKLNKSAESLNIIQSYLNQSLSAENYQSAITKYLEIANFLDLHNLVIEEGENTIDKFQHQLISNYEQQIYGYMIDSFIKTENYKKAKEYINKRKLKLPILKQYLSLLDELKYKKALNEDYYDILKTLTIETTPHEVKTYSYEELLKYYINKNMWQDAYTVIDILNNYSPSSKYNNKKIFILYKQQKYDEVILEGEKFIKQDRKNTEVAIYLIAAYKSLNKPQRAINYEAEYEKDIENLDDNDLKIFAYNEIIDLYDKINNPLSMNLYKDKLKKVKRESKKIEKEIKKETTKIEVVRPQEKSYSNVKYLEHFSWLKDWLIESHNMDSKLALREYLRQMFIEINTKVDFTDAILYLENERESNFFNYKKERLYDKKIIKPYIEGTVIEEVLKTGDSVFGKTDILNKTKDVLTQNKYKDNIKYIFSFPIDNIGVLTFYLDKELLDPSLYYDLYEGITKIIQTRLIDEKIIKQFKNETNFLSKIIQNPLVPLRILTETKSTYNDAAMKMFNIDKYFHLELFLKDLPIYDVKDYNEAVKRLFNYPNETKIIKYSYQNKNIIEYMYAIRKDNEVRIISFFFDDTTNIEKEKELLDVALIDEETGLKSKYSLNKNIENILKDKSSLILLELNREIKYIYGNSKINEYFIEFAKVTEKHFKNYNIYRYDFNQILVVLPFNDIRKVERYILDYNSVMNHYNSKVIPYEKYSYDIGVIRYPVSTKETNVENIYKYLDISLENAKREKNNNYNFFEYQDYEKEVYEQEIINYLNTSIENEELSLVFKQIIDLEKNRIWQYESRLDLPLINISTNYLYIIAKKRNKVVDLDYYHIDAACRFLKKLESETQRLIKLTIPINEETFLNDDFNNYLLGTLKRYNIPYEFIRIVVNTDKKINTDKINYLSEKGISLDTTSIKTTLTHNFHALHIQYNNSNSKWLDYIENLNTFLNSQNIALVVRGIKTKEDIIELKNRNIKYIEGRIFEYLEEDKLINKIKDSIK